MTPYVRHMLLCDDVRQDPTRPKKVNVFGLVNTLRPKPGESYPAVLDFVVYVVLTSGRGRGQLRITIADADTGGIAFETHQHAIQFLDDPLKTTGVIFRIRGSRLPSPGLYWVELRYNDAVIAREALLAEVAQ